MRCTKLNIRLHCISELNNIIYIYASIDLGMLVYDAIIYFSFVAIRKCPPITYYTSILEIKFENCFIRCITFKINRGFYFRSNAWSSISSRRKLVLCKKYEWWSYCGCQSVNCYSGMSKLFRYCCSSNFTVMNICLHMFLKF